MERSTPISHIVCKECQSNSFTVLPTRIAQTSQETGNEKFARFVDPDLTVTTNITWIHGYFLWSFSRFSCCSPCSALLKRYLFVFPNLKDKTPVLFMHTRADKKHKLLLLLTPSVFFSLLYSAQNPWKKGKGCHLCYFSVQHGDIGWSESVIVFLFCYHPWTLLLLLHTCYKKYIPEAEIFYRPYVPLVNNVIWAGSVRQSDLYYVS